MGTTDGNKASRKSRLVVFYSSVLEMLADLSEPWKASYLRRLSAREGSPPPRHQDCPVPLSTHTGRPHQPAGEVVLILIRGPGKKSDSKDWLTAPRSKAMLCEQVLLPR